MALLLVRLEKAHKAAGLEGNKGRTWRKQKLDLGTIDHAVNKRNNQKWFEMWF